MQTVTADFLTGITATERRIKARAEITLLDNPPSWLGAAFSASSTYDALLTPASQAFNGRNYPQRKWAWVGADCFPSMDLYPVHSDGSSEIGWWSNDQCDANGDFASPQWVAVDYGSNQTIKAISVHCYKPWGIPVEQTIEYSLNGTDWTTLEVTPLDDNSSSLYWNIVYIPAADLTARHVRLTFSKWSKPSVRAKIFEVEPGWTIDVTDRIVSCSFTKERSAEDEGSTIPIGNASANEISLVIDNTDGAFYQQNRTSPYYGHLKRNRKVRVWLGLGEYDLTWLPQGVYYTVSWRGAKASPAVTITAWDEAKRMMEKDNDQFPIYEGKRIDEVALLLAEKYGLTVGDYIIQTTDETVSYIWFPKQKFWDCFKALAEGEGGTVYFDEDGVLRFENRYHVCSPRLAADVAAAATSITVGNAYGLIATDEITLDGKNALGAMVTEDVTIDSVSGTTINLTSGLVNDYVADSYVYRTSHGVVATYDASDFIIDMDDQYILDKSRNKIKVNAKPLKVPLDGLGQPVIEAVWQLSDTDDPIIIPAGSYQDMEITFSKLPVLSNLVYSVEVTITGQDMNTLAFVTNDPGDVLSHEWQYAGPFAWGGKLRISSSSANDILIVGILLNGVALVETGDIYSTAEDADLIEWQGERLYEMSSQFIQKRSHAQALADNLLSKYRDMPPPLEVTGRGMFHLQLGDRVKVNDTEMGYLDANLNNHFFLTRIVLDYDGGLDGVYSLLPA